MKNTKDLKKLSGSELDDLILYGVQQQENVDRHSDEYQHWLNVVAAAKEERAVRGKDTGKGAKLADIADHVKDDKVEDRTSPTNLHIAPRGDASETDHEPVDPAAKEGEIPADRINKGIPGVEGGHGEDTPENGNQGTAHTGNAHAS